VDLIRYAIQKPITAAVTVIMVVMFGMIGLTSLPLQLTPDVEEPKITVRTVWAGATPYEIEQEVIEKQEEALKGVQNLIKLESVSYNSLGEITLTFKVGTDLNVALLRVSNKLNEVSDYPANAERPAIDAAGAQSSPIIWTMLKMKSGDPVEILKFETFFENEVRQHLERVEGVGSLFVAGGTANELHVVLDTAKMARHNITIDTVIAKIQGANQNLSAGILNMGKKEYRLRTISQFQTARSPLDVVIYDNGVTRIRLRDIAETKIGHEKQTTSVMHNKQEGIVVGVRKEPGANVIELTHRLKAVVNDLNDGILAEQNIFIDWLYDQEPYINRAIDIVQRNVFLGGFLAIVVLLVFLRSITATITTAVAIPISAVGTFIFLWVTGRNINVVSLAGISFAVGMLVDNAIVVLENIDRHRKMGKKAFTAAYDGAREVLGAVFASTVTTVAVFVPVIFIEEEAGQLFRDIAIAITFSILLSLFVSVAVIPTLLHQFYRRIKRPDPSKPPSLIVRVGQTLSSGILYFSNLTLKNVATRLAAVVLFTALSVGLVLLLIPKAEYLPQGNRNLILGILVPPPGLSVDKRKANGNFIYEQAAPYMGEGEKEGGLPGIKNLFYVATPNFNIFGALSHFETRARELIPLFTRMINAIPDMFGISIQAGIFQSDIGGGRTVDVNLSGESLTAMIGVARQLFGGIMGAIPGSQVRPIPSLEISYPEVSMVPDKTKLAANGLTEGDLGIYLDILMDGRKIDEYRPEGQKQIDLILKGRDSTFNTPEELLNGLIVNRSGSLIRVADVARAEYGQGMTQINHLERKRTIKLQVTPPDKMPLEAAIETIEDKLIAPMQESGQLSQVQVSVGGNADKLDQTRQALQWNFILAVVITYLLMAALFENFFYPLIILFTVPLAAAGGFLGLFLVNRLVAPQAFDVLAMLGFIILVGTVVNNAILVVHQALNNIRIDGMEGVAAITESVRIRIRPIFMSATTSIFALFPLVVSTGSGSELYRGLGSILLGGLAMSTIFTLFVIPALLAFFIGWEKPDEAKNEVT